MAKTSKKAKATGRKQHRQLKRAKEIQRKHKKKAALPATHKKNRS